MHGFRQQGYFSVQYTRLLAIDFKQDPARRRSFDTAALHKGNFRILTMGSLVYGGQACNKAGFIHTFYDDNIKEVVV